MAGSSDQPRWPRGTPWQERGPGPGRFRDADTTDWAARISGRIGRRGLAHYVDRTDFVTVGTAGGAQGRVEFRQYGDGRYLARKVLHPGSDQRWIEKEVDASLVAQIIGARVPEMVRDGSHSILMERIPGETADQRQMHDSDLWREDPDGMRRLALLDLLIGNNDRHHSNVIVDPDGHVWGIDHGFSFDDQWYYPEGDPPQDWEVGLAVGVSRLFREIYDEETQTVVRREQVGFRRAELEQIRERIAADTHIHPDRIRGMLRVLEVVLSVTPA